MKIAMYQVVNTSISQAGCKSISKNSSEFSLQTLGGSLNSQEQSTSTSSKQCSATPEAGVGGQAIIEGIMMRSQNRYALAVRLSNGKIHVESKPWYRFSTKPLYQKPFFRGFPLLVETLINGIKTLNRSAELSSIHDEEPLTQKQLLLTLFFSILMAIGLFVVLPHALSFGMQYFELAGDVQTFSFQIWDGLFKFIVFFLYLAGISLIPDVRRVFQFHGAEHKSIAAYEKCKEGQVVDINLVRKQSRLHPRCGTTFLLFVLSIAILIHTIFLPPLLWLWEPHSEILKHAVVLVIKIALMIPISALAYELIRLSSKSDGFFGFILKAPGLLLQLLTTREPEDEHLEVALVALKAALGENTKHTIITSDDTNLE